MQKIGFIFTQTYWDSDHGPHIGDEDIPGIERLSKLPKVKGLGERDQQGAYGHKAHLPSQTYQKDDWIQSNSPWNQPLN